MDRRTTGVLLLVALACLVLTVPGLTGRRITGSAKAAVIPPPPAVGDCAIALSAPPPTGENLDDDAPVTYPTIRLGSCAGVIVGEVMSIDTSAHPLGEVTIGSYQSASSACQLDEVNYVGSIGPFDPATITTPGIAWQAAVTVDSVAVGPSALQRAGGQSWTACIGTTADGSGYRGRIARALDTGVLPPVFATCWRYLTTTTDQSVEDQQMSCAAPHSFEVLAVTQIFDPKTTPAKVTRSCVGMASRALRTADPTRGGRLRIAAYSFGDTAIVPVTSVPYPAGVVCLASVPAPLRLTGTLIGIGAKPLPITG